MPAALTLRYSSIPDDFFRAKNMNNKIFQIDPENPQPDVIKQAADAIKKGGVIVFPTWCLYGLAADAFNTKAIDKVFAIKNRRPENPLLILIKNRNELKKFVTEIPDTAKRIMDDFWPGRVTIIFKAKETIPDSLTAGTGKIGIRLPEHPVALALLEQLENPVTGTSANISNDPGCNDINKMAGAVTDQADCTLDAGKLNGGIGSTIIDVTCNPPAILRDGEIPAEEIIKIIS